MEKSMVDNESAAVLETTRKTIQDIKEITAGNYSEEEIFSMLHECSMDPDETTQRLLLQEPFHEVKTKRSRRKENNSNKVSVEPPQRYGGQGRGIRNGRIYFSSRHPSHDVTGAKNSFRKENGPVQITDRSASTSQKIKTKEIFSVSRPSAKIEKSSVGLTSGSSDVHYPSNIPASSGQHQNTGSSILSNGLANSLPLPRPSSSKVRSISSNPEQTAHEHHLRERKFHTRSSVVGNTTRNNGYAPRPTSSNSNSTGSRPSSNYSNRSHQSIGRQRGTGPIKEWKPKQANHKSTQGSASSTTEPLAVPPEAIEKSVEEVIPSAEATSILQSQLEDLKIQRQNVIIPDHILIPEAERTQFSFGSFGSFEAGFSITSNSVASSENEKRSAPLSQNSGDVEEEEFRYGPVSAFASTEGNSHQTAHSSEKEEDATVKSESPSEVLDVIVGEGIDAANAAPEHDVSKQENVLESESNQNSVVNVPSNVNGFVPPASGSQLSQIVNAEPQARDAHPIPTYMVQQPFDAASYYPQFYPSGPDSEGRVSVLPPYSPMQEVGNNLVLSTASPTPLVTQAAGMMQSSMPVTQQPSPFYRHSGLHMPQYPPNYAPYGHYYSQYGHYLPPQPMHQFLSNSAYAQQPQASSVYSAAPPPVGATGGRYTPPHYKPGTNTGNLSHVGMPGSYGPAYGSFPAVNPTANEDLNSVQMKEHNGYITAGQSEAMPVWYPGPGQDVSNSFYGLQHHGQHQHVNYSQTTQASHGAFPSSMYHPGPGQAVTGAGAYHLFLQQQSQGVGGSEMVAHLPNGYQQPQQTQMTRPPSNYSNRN